MSKKGPFKSFNTGRDLKPKIIRTLRDFEQALGVIEILLPVADETRLSDDERALVRAVRAQFPAIRPSLAETIADLDQKLPSLYSVK